MVQDSTSPTESFQPWRAIADLGRPCEEGFDSVRRDADAESKKGSNLGKQ